MASTQLYDYTPHQRTRERLEHLARPIHTRDLLPTATRAERFNTRLAVLVTTGVGTMWCAYAFAGLALVSLPAAIRTGSDVVLVSWVSQTFLQLVLLSVIIVGQNVLADAADKRAEATYSDAAAALHEAVKLQEHLAAQDAVLAHLADEFGRRPADPDPRTLAPGFIILPLSSSLPAV